ncbi:hypothetical protein [Streptomyces sp. URMC 129]|uniref:hypothetical protein n=1 Tax=Streptomyces sp. URMC 129 TaxID=3423407 RepID=UPI003F1A3AA6
MTASLGPLLREVTTILLDFDGLVCSVFAGLSADEVADRMRQRIAANGHTVEVDWETESRSRSRC